MKEVKPKKESNIKELIEKDRQERIQRTNQAIKDILDKEKCTLDVSMIITTQGNMPQLNIVAKD